MDLELIAGVVSERLSAAAEVDLKPEEARDRFAKPQANDNPKPQISDITDSAILELSQLSPGDCTHPDGACIEESLDTRGQA